jgi:alpha-ketoglutarate-dependent taurine dioxygenase
MSSTVQPTPEIGTPSSRPGTGIVEFDIGDRDIETDAVSTVLADYYGDDVRGAALTPPGDPADLRARLAGAAPQLAEIAHGVRGAFGTGACGVFVPRLGLAALDLDRRRESVFALAVLLGNVTETEPADHRVLWDVKAAPADARRFSKFSQDSGEAQYHTDSTIVPVPERFFLLYAVRQAGCGGGLSTLQDGRGVKHRLEQTPAGRRAIQTLTRTHLPIRIPRSFRKKYGSTAADGYSYTPVLADKPMWRWRKDKIEQGLAEHPWCATPEVREALDTVSAVLADPTGEFRVALPTDALVIINNHVAFHGRTAFTDPDRHLLRIRFHDVTETDPQTWRGTGRLVS